MDTPVDVDVYKRQAGGLPVELTRDADVEGILARLDGLILSGGADVEPDRYGHHADENLGAIEPDLSLIHI